MRIGEVATRTGTPIKTIRYYEEIGVLSAPTRSPSGYRDFDEDVIDRLHFIRSSKAVGFSLNEIRGIVIYRERGEIPCAHVLKLLEHHRDDVAERLTALEEARVALDSLLARASKLRQENCSPNSVCHLIPKRTAQGLAPPTRPKR
jgi:MerR family copper efflux transcriptional regulator